MEIIPVAAWSVYQYERYLNHVGLRVLIPREQRPERPEVEDVVNLICPDGRFEMFRIAAMPTCIKLKRNPVNLSFDHDGINPENAIRWTGYLKSGARMVREMPADVLPPGEWRGFWLAAVQKKAAVKPTPEPEPVIPVVPAKRRPGRPRKGSKK